MDIKQLNNRKFGKSAFGYKPEEVNEYLEEIVDYVSNLIREKEDLQNKMEILATRIQQYRGEREQTKELITSAQEKRNQILQEAIQKAEEITDQARKNLDTTLTGLSKDIDREQKVLKGLKKEVSDFKKKLISIYKQHMTVITKLPEIEEAADEASTETLDQQEAIETQEVVVKSADENEPKQEAYKLIEQPEAQEQPEPEKSEVEENIDNADEDIKKSLIKDEAEHTRVVNDTKTEVESKMGGYRPAPKKKPRVEIDYDDKETDAKDMKIEKGNGNYESKFGELKFGKFNKQNKGKKKD